MIEIAITRECAGQAYRALLDFVAQRSVKFFLVNQFQLTETTSPFLAYAKPYLQAERCGLREDLGEKGQSGILQSMATRAAFLSDATHRLQVVYVPKHTSWLNQVEMWFSILVRRVLKRGNFASVDALGTRILEFIEYFNQTAKPFKWTYTGRPLVI